MAQCRLFVVHLTLKNIKRASDAKTAPASNIEMRHPAGEGEEGEDDADEQAWRDRHAYAYDSQEAMETRLIKLS
jgi:hypothetical protein